MDDLQLKKIIEKYFHIIIQDKYNKIEVNLKLKNIFKRPCTLFKQLSNGKKINYTPTHIEYFLNYFEYEEAKMLFDVRKKFLSKQYLIKFILKNYEINNELKIKLEKIIEETYKKRKNSLLAFYKSENGKNKILKSTNNPILKEKISVSLKNKWNDNIWKTQILKKRETNNQYLKQSQTMKKIFQDPEKKKEIIKKRLINGTFIEKLKKIGKEKYRNGDLDKWMLAGQKIGNNKKYYINNFYMNFNEYLVAKLLNELNLKWFNNYKIQINNKKLFVDFYLPEYNLIIECYGDYWHANPLIYSENQYLERIGKTAKQIWDINQERINKIKSNNYNVLILWEKNIKNNIILIKEEINQCILKKN